MSAAAFLPSSRSTIASSDPVPVPESVALSPLLDLALLQAGALGAYVYSFDRVNVSTTLVASAGAPPAHPGRTLARHVAPLHWERTSALVLPSQAAADWRFAAFPELQAAPFDGVVSVPLLDSGETVGLANFSRKGKAPLSAAALSFLISLSLPLGTILIASSLRDRLHKATQELADRKLLERAKGLLQARFQWTEEEAYLRIRRLSRRSRIAMREIAHLVLESGPESLAEVLEQNE